MEIVQLGGEQEGISDASNFPDEVKIFPEKSGLDPINEKGDREGVAMHAAPKHLPFIVVGLAAKTVANRFAKGFGPDVAQLRGLFHTVKLPQVLDNANSEKAVHHDAEDAEGALVFEAFGGFFHFLEGELGVVNETFVVDELADGTLALIYL